MIQEKFRNKDKDLKGMKKALAEMLDHSWEKGYVAGFNDGYATRREEGNDLEQGREAND